MPTNARTASRTLIGEWRIADQDVHAKRGGGRQRSHSETSTRSRTSGGLPIGQARGKIILPCGTGKTRISLRIIEELTGPGELSIVLCPSIALVAQIRREYLQHAEKGIRPLAVCSDKTAGYDQKDPRLEEKKNSALDPTVDNSNVSALELQGTVTTNADEIAKWIRDGAGQRANQRHLWHIPERPPSSGRPQGNGRDGKGLIGGRGAPDGGAPAEAQCQKLAGLRRGTAHTRFHAVPRQ